MCGSVKDIQSKEELSNVISHGGPVTIHFWASLCEASKQMDQVFSHLSTDFPHAHFVRVEAEEQPEISEAHSVSAVPFLSSISSAIRRKPSWNIIPCPAARQRAQMSHTSKPSSMLRGSYWNNSIPSLYGNAPGLNRVKRATSTFPRCVLPII